MTVRDTSREAFKTVDLGARQADVLAAIRELGECTDAEIAAHLGFTINRVTPRRGELLAAGLVENCGRKIGPTGRGAMVWRIAKPKPVIVAAPQPTFQPSLFP